MMRAGMLALGLLLSAGAARGEPSPARPITLEEAVARAVKNQPKIWQARAATQAAQARADAAFSPLLPQVNVTGSYQRTTRNFAFRPGTVPANLTGTSATFNTVDFYNFGLTAQMNVFDFGQTRGRLRAAEATAASQQASEQGTREQVVLDVRVAYFTLYARGALLEVARERLGNQDRHLAQVEGLVELGARPPIDRAQARADRASAEVDLIQAENAREVARIQLALAMGEDGGEAFDATEGELPEVRGEEGPVEALLEGAKASRAELRSIRLQEEAQRRTVAAIRAAYWPSLGIGTSATEAGTTLDALVWNWNASATVTWPIYQGGLTRAQVREAEANLAASVAQERLLVAQVRLEIAQAQLAARAAKGALRSAEVAVLNARERYRLAEGRYSTGVGSLLELDDAQVALSTALSQKVEAALNLAVARAQLRHAVGSS